MAEGHKKGDFIRSGPQAAASANVTEIGYIERKNREANDPEKKVLKKWVKKVLQSEQEVLIECITGEIYRYIIGGYQPKIRTGDENTILSEFIPYRSLRDVLGNPQYKHNAKAFKESFIQNLNGFMLVLFSSIMLEENDLSDMNYGLAINPGGVDIEKEMQESEAYKKPDPKKRGYAIFGRKASSPEPVVCVNDVNYYGFIKIDHGQSLNSMRIATKKSLGLAEIKYYPPSTSNNLEEVTGIKIDNRTKKDRSKIWFTKRKYNIEPYFIDRVLFDFLWGFIDKNYIENLPYQPSTLPLFDGRLLSLFPWRDQVWRKPRPKVAPNDSLWMDIFGKKSGDNYSDIWDRFEESKYFAIAKLVFTHDDLYNAISKNATDIASLNKKQQEIRKKINANIESLYAAINTDLDFCVYCHEKQDDIRKEIKESCYRLAKNRSDNDSGRYASAIGVISPINETRLREITQIGKLFSSESIRVVTNSFISKTYSHIKTNDWKTGGLGVGGKKMGILKRCDKTGKLDKKIVTVPNHVCLMMDSCLFYDITPKYRLFRTLQDLSYLANHANQKIGLYRNKDTQEFYDSVLSDLKIIGNDSEQNLSLGDKKALQFFSGHYKVIGQERFVDLTTLYAKIQLFQKTT